MDFKETIEVILKGKKLKKAELARLLDIKPQTLNSLLKSNNPTKETVKKIADALEVDISIFFKEEYQPPKGMRLISDREYADLLKLKLDAETIRADNAEKQVAQSKNIEVIHHTA